MAELKYPKGEEIWVGYYNKNHELIMILTSKEGSRDWYYLYERTGNSFKKLGKSHSPKELDEKFDTRRRMELTCGG